MSTTPPSPTSQDALVSCFWSGDTLRSRSVSARVFTGVVDVPAPPLRLTADWQRETTARLHLEPGSVESLSIPRSCASGRWPDYARCKDAASTWARSLGIQDGLDACEIALMACRGARYHHDGEQYGGAVFLNVFLNDDQHLDLHFPLTGQRIPLSRGLAVLFDTGQPHAVIDRGASGFDVAHFPPERDCTLVFLTWELPVEQADVAQLMQIGFDTDTTAASQLEDGQLMLRDAPATLCVNSGRWLLPD